MSENILKEYVDEVYKQADILLEYQEEKEFKQELESALTEKIGEASIDMLDENSKEEYFKFLESKPSNEDIKNFFTSHVNDFNDKINSAIIDFCSEFILKIKKSIIMGSINVDQYTEKEDNPPIEEMLKNEGSKNTQQPDN